MNPLFRPPLLLTVLLVCLQSVVSFSSPAAGTPNILRRAILKVGGGKRWREDVVNRYFDGVQQQNRDQIISCFDPRGTKIRDVCGVSNSERMATPVELGERCMEFLAAHPDTMVKFHYKPTCGRGSSKWVLAHWYEEGTFKGESRGIQPDSSKLEVEGQTRFLVNDDLKITEMVVTRTFSEWENQLQRITSATSTDSSSS
ncbi:hypothetical protein IV203_010137 [Nitzschia inconspicua]|uniref:SnoaL-like domain-containing protein n=1 Tax=Nitzschia inconspicua TaxID=303405 RepID=A0A9K3KVS7_9STRA|nr:hypothetical protein IV203_010137 [Nitzschia inconspicua]